MKTWKQSVWFYDSGNSAIEAVGKNEKIYSKADDYVGEKIQLDFDRKKNCIIIFTYQKLYVLKQSPCSCFEKGLVKITVVVLHFKIVFKKGKI